MTRAGLFGWAYPPGCSGPPDPYDGPCEICGQDIEGCVCPECPECSGAGDPYCYLHHGLKRTEEQKFLLEVAKKEWKKEAEAEDAYWKEYLGEED